jgi:hypothetical protein
MHGVLRRSSEKKPKIRGTLLGLLCGIGSSESEQEFRNLAAPQIPENHGTIIIIEF